MAGRGEYQKQLAALVAAAKAAKLKLEDIVPEDLEAEFSQKKELKEAQELIKDLQEREAGLQAVKETLTKDLSDKQSEINNLPADYQSMKIDLQQAQRQIDNYKDTITDLNKRVDRYRAQAEVIVDVKRADTAAVEKIEKLQIQIEHQQTIIKELMGDNRKSEAMFEQLRVADTKALERKDNLLTKKDKELTKKDKELAEKEEELAEKKGLLAELRQQAQKSRYADFVQDGDKDTKTLVDASSQDELVITHEQNIDLLEENLRLTEDNRALEEQHIQMKMQLCETVATLESSDRVFAAVMSETKTLSRFYQASFQVIGSFATCFSESKANIPTLNDIDSQLDAAQDALMGYFEVKKVVRAINNMPDKNDMDQVALCKQLDSLAETASDSTVSLEILQSGLWSFLDQLSHDPKMMSDLNAAIDLTE